MPGTRLVTIPMSHYCDKARWGLERAGIGYVEEGHVQGISLARALLAGGRRTVPVLVAEGRVLSDSTDILVWCDAVGDPPSPLFPVDAGVEALVARFSADLGPATRALMYHQMLPRRSLSIRYGSHGLPRWERALLRAAYPVLGFVLPRWLRIDANCLARSRDLVDTIFAEVAERLADGRRYLAGDALTAADISFAAMASPVVLPRQYGIPLPTPDELPPAYGALVRELRAHPAGAFALRLYREDRRP